MGNTSVLSSASLVRLWRTEGAHRATGVFHNRARGARLSAVASSRAPIGQQPTRMVVEEAQLHRSEADLPVPIADGLEADRLDRKRFAQVHTGTLPSDL